MFAMAFTMSIMLASCFAAEEPGKMAATDRSQVDADYAIQGEYVGTFLNDDNKEVEAGAQVIALGDGQFNIVGYDGGLPGDGWKRGDKMHKGTAETKDGKVIVLDENNKSVGEIKDGKISIDVDGKKCELKRIERKSPTLGLQAPEGATVIFDGKTNNTDAEVNENGVLYSNFTTKPKFDKPYTAHIEFLLQYMPYARGQGRSNSGCYFHDAYELQVLDSFGLEGVDNECGGIYKASAPKVNMCLPPLQWQTYDADFTPPTYDADGKKTAPAKLVVKHNGVLIQDLVLETGTPGRQSEGPGPRPIHFQGHGNKVQYRNIWVQEK